MKAGSQHRPKDSFAYISLKNVNVIQMNLDANVKIAFRLKYKADCIRAMLAVLPSCFLADKENKRVQW